MEHDEADEVERAARLPRGHGRRDHDDRVRRRPGDADRRRRRSTGCASSSPTPRRSTTSTSSTTTARLVGVLSLRDLIVAQPETPIARRHDRRAGRGRRRSPTRTRSPRSSPATTCWRCRSSTTSGRLVGIVTVDDAIDTSCPASLAAARQPRAGTRGAEPRDCLPIAPRLRERIAARVALVRPAAAGSAAGAASLAFLAVMGPGLIAGIAGNDAGGITTYSVMGADDRADACCGCSRSRSSILAIVQEMAARLGVVTGPGPVRPDPRPVRGALDGLRDGRPARRQRREHRRRVLRAPRRRSRSSAISRYIVGAARRRSRIWALVLHGQLPDGRAGLPVGHRRVPRLHRVGGPGPPGLGRGRPGARDADRSTWRRPTLLLMVAVVGTTITPYMQFYLQSAVAEKGIGEEELRLEQADAVVGSIWTNVIAIFIVVATATHDRRRGRHDHDGGRRGAGARAGRRHGSPRRCSRSACSGRACWRRRSCRSRTAFVICEAFGWESGVGKRFRDAPRVLRDLHVRAGRRRARRAHPGPRPAPGDHRARRTCRACCCRSCSSSWSCSSTTGG